MSGSRILFPQLHLELGKSLYYVDVIYTLKEVCKLKATISFCREK